MTKIDISRHKAQTAAEAFKNLFLGLIYGTVVLAAIAFAFPVFANLLEFAFSFMPKP